MPNKDIDHNIDYKQIVLNSIYKIVSEALILKELQIRSLGGNAIYISFNTAFLGVKMPFNLKEEHPREMVIVLEHEFENLIVDEKYFSVTLFFDNLPANLTIPFAAINIFFDASAQFILNIAAFCQSDSCALVNLSISPDADEKTQQDFFIKKEEGLGILNFLYSLEKTISKSNAQKAKDNTNDPIDTEKSDVSRYKITGANGIADKISRIDIDKIIEEELLKILHTTSEIREAEIKNIQEEVKESGKESKKNLNNFKNNSNSKLDKKKAKETVTLSLTKEQEKKITQITDFITVRESKAKPEAKETNGAKDLKSKNKKQKSIIDKEKSKEQVEKKKQKRAKNTTDKSQDIKLKAEKQDSDDGPTNTNTKN